MYKKVRDQVYSNRRIQVEEIAQALGISHSNASTILHDRLGVRKLTARWVPKSLSDEQMATRASVCNALLKRFRPKDDFLLRLVTVDETLVHYYEPENKAQSRQWVGPGSPRPKKLATVFWDAKCVIMLDFLPKRSTITEVYYANCLDQLRTVIREKTPRLIYGRGLVDRKLVEAPSNFIADRPKAALLLCFFGDFRCGVPLFIVILVI